MRRRGDQVHEVRRGGREEERRTGGEEEEWRSGGDAERMRESENQGKWLKRGGEQVPCLLRHVGSTLSML